MSDLIELFKAAVWPAIVVLLVVKFGQPLHAMLQSVADGRASLDVGPSGLRVTQAAQSAVAAAVAAGAEAKDAPPAEKAAIAHGIVAAARTSLASAPTLATRRILWVDDTPDNNILLAKSFTELGISVIQVGSTEAALGRLREERFDLVITDMGRPPDHTAGLTLLRRMREMGTFPPTIIYAARWAAANRGKEAELGAALITNRPGEVYARALELLQRS
ncbi:response regulator [Siccirubricoccus sp. KC 17139]|uniref:Response regulator n=1 Tax=Siccirubricoccus soli TaxID=2899147 RepID=A0ABT1CZ68_9PROT|nr:response regulator [Siccirubricoccus soli]MCO6414968.1 response regulator [Siccirubricoccus soli]MCP2681099.1 response regulator [Siccirubricoccus soli]